MASMVVAGAGVKWLSAKRTIEIRRRRADSSYRCAWRFVAKPIVGNAFVKGETTDTHRRFSAFRRTLSTASVDRARVRTGPATFFRNATDHFSALPAAVLFRSSVARALRR